MQKQHYHDANTQHQLDCAAGDKCKDVKGSEELDLLIA